MAACGGCTECSVPPPSPPAQCKTYCAYRTHPIEEKCEWSDCNGCPTCDFTIPVAFRVLTGSEYCHLTISSDGRSCVTDGPGDYGNHERCTVEVLQTGLLSATEFVTESCCDHISIDDPSPSPEPDPDGADPYGPYNGRGFPSNLPVTAGTTFSWSSDGSVTQMGWTICFQLAPPAP